jgi:hypothetical protein
LDLREREKVIARGLVLARERNGYETRIEDRAVGMIAHLSEGYPHFVQQFAYSAFEHDTDNNISEEDVSQGAFKENGALDQLGKRYFSELYFDKIASDDYRKVLNAMAEHLDDWVTRKEIITTSNVKESQVNNALAALKDRNIILVSEEKQGLYRLPTKSFAVWIKAVNARRESTS